MGGEKAEVNVLKGIDRLAADMTARITRQDMLAENLANASTPGYKIQRLFMTLLRESVRSGGKVTDDKAYGIYTDFGQGPVDVTDRPLDFAINGEGFFVVETSMGEVYTRAGNFTLDEEGTLITNRGETVQGTSGPITIESEDFTVSAEGKVVVDGAEIGAIKIVTFRNPNNLVRRGNYYVAQGQAAEESEMIDTQVLQGALERANVSPVDEMVNMITVHRGFEAAQTTIKMQDEGAKKLIENAGNVG
jgi:flagellar basal-body rod protein FlgF